MPRAGVSWSVIVETADSHEAIGLAITAVIRQGCSQVMPYQVEMTEHPDSGGDAWEVRLRAECETGVADEQAPKTLVIAENGGWRVE